MKEYIKLAKKVTFSLKDVTDITGNKSTSTSLISRWLKKNYVARIRKDLYTCIDLTTGDVIANKYQIACAINEDAYVSHHTAFEFYGMANQVYNTVYVSSYKRFNDFEFRGIRYKSVNTNFKDGVIAVKNIEGLKVTDIERTYVDSINFVSKISGVEELINISQVLGKLDEDKLLKYLEIYNKKILYQKIGYFLSNYYEGEKISNNFFDICHLKSSKSVRYLIQKYEGKFDNIWNLVIPEEFIVDKNKQGAPNDYI
jgi:predicted transcriptional regulator of viral defense system